MFQSIVSNDSLLQMAIWLHSRGNESINEQFVDRQINLFAYY